MAGRGRVPLWSTKAAWVATAHLGVGALLWAVGLILALRSGQALDPAPVPAESPASRVREIA